VCVLNCSHAVIAVAVAIVVEVVVVVVVVVVVAATVVVVVVVDSGKSGLVRRTGWSCKRSGCSSQAQCPDR